MRTADCRIWGFVATVAAEKGIDLSYLVTNLEFFPILPKDGCEQLRAALVSGEVTTVDSLSTGCFYVCGCMRRVRMNGMYNHACAYPCASTCMHACLSGDARAGMRTYDRACVRIR